MELNGTAEVKTRVNLTATLDFTVEAVEHPLSCNPLQISLENLKEKKRGTIRMPVCAR